MEGRCGIACIAQLHQTRYRGAVLRYMRRGLIRHGREGGQGFSETDGMGLQMLFEMIAEGPISCRRFSSRFSKQSLGFTERVPV